MLWNCSPLSLLSNSFYGTVELLMATAQWKVRVKLYLENTSHLIRCRHQLLCISSTPTCDKYQRNNCADCWHCVRWPAWFMHCCVESGNRERWIKAMCKACHMTKSFSMSALACTKINHSMKGAAALFEGRPDGRMELNSHFFLHFSELMGGFVIPRYFLMLL